jgi:hypothetical protein
MARIRTVSFQRQQQNHSRTMTHWTKFSDRLPPEDYDDVFVETKPGHIAIWKRVNTINNTWKDYTESGGRWHPITYPELPPREETQADRDGDQFDAWYKMEAVAFPVGAIRPCDAWHAALAWERAEVAKALNTLCLAVINEDRTVWENLRKRCGANK